MINSVAAAATSGAGKRMLANAAKRGSDGYAIRPPGSGNRGSGQSGWSLLLVTLLALPLRARLRRRTCS